MNNNGIVTEEFGNILQDLCMAQYAENYCSSCASGSGCCADAELKDPRTNEDCEADMIKYHEVNSEKEDCYEERKIRRKTLTIDLSNDDDLSDGEILKRLLSPLESPLSDEPLEVILEIVDEEDDDDVDFPAHKTFKSLRDKLRKITSNKPSRETRSTSLYWKRQLRKIKQDLDSSCYDFEDNSSRYSSLELCPSYQKANSLINEIERCFMETANLVERSIESVKNQETMEIENSIAANKDLLENQLSKEQFTSTVQESLRIFDALLNGHKTAKQTESITDNIQAENNNNSNNHIPPTNIDISNTHNSINNNSDNSDEHDYQNIEGINDRTETWHQRVMSLRGGSSFEKDIDDLFKECYELTSVEPSTTLPSCLKNLESLCFQLNRVKENILMEMKSDYKYGLTNDNNDCYGSQASSLDSQECLSIINELIDKKLKEKLKRTKFNLDPPLMGLEGKTHKRIAEIIPPNFNSENEIYFSKENGTSENYYLDNYHILKNHSDSINNEFDEPFERIEFNSECTSEMSTTTNTLNSSRCFSSSSNTGLYKNGNINKCSETFEDIENTTMSYEETLALYEDNQELQKSLLSILHSLNDIHDNFLNRRRMEMDLSQQNSDFIQNHLKSEIYSSNQRTEEANKQCTNSYVDSMYFNTDNVQNQFKKDFSVKKTDDFESIEKIIRVSEELKNLWLYASKDLELSSRKPTRTVSFNRGVKRYKQFSDYYEESISDEYDYLDSNQGKSLSLPNLSLYPDDAYEGYSTASSLNSPVSPNQPKNETDAENFFVDNFVKHMRDEHSKSYEVTLDFLQKMINSSKIIEEETPIKNFVPQDVQSQNYNAFQRTY